MVQPVYYAHILRCADGSFYVGSTQNLASRIRTHNDGRGAAYTFTHRPFHLVYSERFLSEMEASARERQLKRWSHEKKAALIAGNLERLKRLQQIAARRTHLLMPEPYPARLPGR